ncbi:hypothetical protein [Qipengyuania aquimaris]|uniref:hypothetical protein n=1 Tax=Qipengyuania aquimaris TaxID=255984 RepID=UPI001CD55BE6|nr:hypothetical protein [Qipengyuania aquimaris]MCA0904572.1 hypothetical protein [Qipengyuania aquimaris]
MSDTKPPVHLPDFTPVPRQRDRSNGWKPHVQRAFIEALADTGSVASACRAVNRSTHGAYSLRRQPGAEEFAAAWEAALDFGMKRIEDVAMDRALNGVEVPVYSYGQLVGTRISYNDRLLMFMLRNRAPERFAEGRAKAMNAIGKMDLKRKKKEWRAEWEAEQARVTPAEVRASIERKVQDTLALMERNHSPRAWAAWQEYKRIRAEDAANGYRAQDDPDHPHYAKRTTPEDPAAPCVKGSIPLTLPQWQKSPEEPRQEKTPDNWTRMQKSEGD